MLKAKIVASDDDFQNLELYKAIFEGGHCEQVCTFCDAETAIEYIKKIQPDLLITDMNKSGISGLEMARLLKNDKLTQQIPILLVSGDQSLDRFADLGLFCAVLEKPIDIRDIERLVEASFARKFVPAGRVSEFSSA